MKPPPNPPRPLAEPPAVPPNAARTATRLDFLRTIRTAGGLPVGREPGECPPEVATDLERAGLARVEVPPGGRKRVVPLA